MDDPQETGTSGAQPVPRKMWLQGWGRLISLIAA